MMILNEEAEDFQYKKNRKNSFFFGSIAAMQVIKFRFHYTIFFLPCSPHIFHKFFPAIRDTDGKIKNAY
jgi:hypothetical protein